MPATATKPLQMPAPPDELAALRAQLAAKIAAHIRIDGVEDTPIPGLRLYRKTAPTECYSNAYEPEFVVCAQGEKHITVGAATHICDATTCLLASIDLPAVSRVVRASPQQPLLSMVLKLQMPVIREILSQQDFPTPEHSFAARGLAIGKTPAELLSACLRLIDLLDQPRDIAFLGGLMQREIIYRLLRGPLGRHLRAIATHGEQSNRTARAVAWLKENYAKPLRVEDLASIAQMGVSTFHHHFRSLTAMSPLQYQKRLRLHVARLRMIAEGMDAASAAFDVGYESPSQFNREYSRLFGQPPMRDVKGQRLQPLASANQ